MLRAGGDPYSYDVFERRMMVAYGSTYLSEQSKLAYWALKQHGPLRPLLVEMKLHLSRMEHGIRPTRDAQIQHLLDIMYPELLKAVKRRGSGKGGAWTNLEDLMAFVVKEDDNQRKERVAVLETAEGRESPFTQLMKKRKAEALERRGGGSSIPVKKGMTYGSAEKGGSSSRFQGQGQS